MFGSKWAVWAAFAIRETEHHELWSWIVLRVFLIFRFVVYWKKRVFCWLHVNKEVFNWRNACLVGQW